MNNRTLAYFATIENVLTLSCHHENGEKKQTHSGQNIKEGNLALAGVAGWIGCKPLNQKVPSWITKSGHMPGLWARSPARGT